MISHGLPTASAASRGFPAEAAPGGVARRPGGRSASRKLVLTALTLTALLAVAIGVMIWQLRRNALADARLTVGALATAIAEQTSRSIQSADVVLQDLRTQIIDRRLNSVAEFKAALSNETLFNFLKDRTDILPQVDALTVIAADGRLVNFSRQWPVPPTNLADRDYLKYFSTHDSPDVFISMPVQNRGNGTWTCYVVRRINAPDGTFIGMVLAAVDLEYFREFFRALTDQARTTVMLTRQDGVMLTSYPATLPVGSALRSGFGWHHLVRQGSGSLEVSDGLVPGPQLVAVHALTDYPLVVNVVTAQGLILDDWIRTSTIICLAAFFTFLCFVLLIWEQLKQFGRVERSETLLEARNAELKSSQRTLRHQAEELSADRAVMVEQAATLAGALRHMNQGIIMVDAEDRLVVCNERAAALLELPPDFLAGRPTFGDLVAHLDGMGDFDAPEARPWKVTAQQALDNPVSFERTRPNGTVLQIQTVPLPGGGLVRTYTDLTERKKTEHQVAFLARHDALTGLYNRTAFHERFEALLHEAARDGSQLGVFYIDLDGFKLVNDTHGHAIGDQLLVTVAARLTAAIRDTDLVARMGGDEFAVLQPFVGPAVDVGDLARRMLAAIAEPYWFGAIRCTVSLSIGVALYPTDARDVAQLLQHADMALYRAKAAGKARFCLYDAATDQVPTASIPVQHDLADAIRCHQLYLEYQPIVDTATLALVRYEALLRWQHPVRGLVPAAEFIPVAERTGLMVEIGLWALETACLTASAWPAHVGLSVNLSPLQFAPGDLAVQVERILDRTGFPPARLNLEITEGVVLESTAAVIDTMTRLRGLGIRFSLDDFGTAYAGLTYLRSFPFDVLKIDKSFVQDAVRTQTSLRLLGAIQAIGKACDLQVVAEGIETEQELAVVRAMGCEHVQGYLLGRPVQAATIDPGAVPHTA